MNRVQLLVDGCMFKKYYSVMKFEVSEMIERWKWKRTSSSQRHFAEFGKISEQ